MLEKTIKGHIKFLRSQFNFGAYSSSSSSSGIVNAANMFDNQQNMTPGQRQNQARRNLEDLADEINSSIPMRIRRLARLKQLIRNADNALINLNNKIQLNSGIEQAANRLLKEGRKMDTNINRILPLEKNFTAQMENDIRYIRQHANIALQNASRLVQRGTHFGGATMSRITGPTRNRINRNYERITGRESPMTDYYPPETPRERRERMERADMRRLAAIRQAREEELLARDLHEWERFQNEQQRERQHGKQDRAYFYRLNQRVIKGRPSRN
jgi:hypothetical protein